MARSKRRSGPKKRHGRLRKPKISARQARRFIAGLVVYLAVIALLAVFRSPIKELIPGKPRTPPAAGTIRATKAEKKDILKKTPAKKPAEKPAKKIASTKKAAKPSASPAAAAASPVKKAVAPSPAPAMPVTPRRDGPVLVFVIDDIGNTRLDQGLLQELGRNVTYAILPALPHSRYFAEVSRKTGAEVILHLPMEAIKGPTDDPGKIAPGMSRASIVQTLRADIDHVPGLRGVNNHKGSLATSDPELMSVVLEYLKENGLFFLDSFTNPESVVCDICRKNGMPVLRRDIFLDNSSDPDEIKAQITRLQRVAQKKGYAIAIGHYRPNTLRVLSETIPRLKEEGYQLMSLSGLIKWRQSGRQ